VIIAGHAFMQNFDVATTNSPLTPRRPRGSPPRSSNSPKRSDRRPGAGSTRPSIPQRNGARPSHAPLPEPGPLTSCAPPQTPGFRKDEASCSLYRSETWLRPCGGPLLRHTPDLVFYAARSYSLTPVTRSCRCWSAISGARLATRRVPVENAGHVNATEPRPGSVTAAPRWSGGTTALAA
jgi:hypothetical protein